MSKESLSPVDQCGCGDIGYLTSRTITVPLAHGVGKVHHVPVYSCNSSWCDEYTIPSSISSRLDDLAEKMEAQNLITADFSGPSLEEKKEDLLSSLIEGFIWKFKNRTYEDAQVVLIIPGEVIVLQSSIDPSEYYTLKPLEDDKEGIIFIFEKFYADIKEMTYEEYLTLEPIFSKELGAMKIDEVEDALIEEFGEII
ncbi:MAG: hypothetical protein GX958_09495 [Desulfitobacterium sp.]|nr:hypothetical protein [Desulfitobacterium sp.]